MYQFNHLVADLWNLLPPDTRLVFSTTILFQTKNTPLQNCVPSLGSFPFPWLLILILAILFTPYRIYLVLDKGYRSFIIITIIIIIIIICIISVFQVYNLSPLQHLPFVEYLHGVHFIRRLQFHYSNLTTKIQWMKIRRITFNQRKFVCLQTKSVKNLNKDWLALGQTLPGKHCQVSTGVSTAPGKHCQVSPGSKHCRVSTGVGIAR